ncbi:MAG: hypothetical protein RXP77_02705 [Nitrososphaeria archaeon]
MASRRSPDLSRASAFLRNTYASTSSSTSPRRILQTLSTVLLTWESSPGGPGPRTPSDLARLTACAGLGAAPAAATFDATRRA